MILYYFVGHNIAKLLYMQKSSLSNLLGKYHSRSTDAVWNTSLFVYFQEEKSHATMQVFYQCTTVRS